MRELRKCLATGFAHIYVFVIKHKVLSWTIFAVLVMFCVLMAARSATVETWTIHEVETQDMLPMSIINDDRIRSLSKHIYVMIDAGHGGKDPGALYNDIYEKDITLAVAKKVRSILEQKGIDVIMTREDDTFVDKYDRAHLANDQKVDLFLSIHVNDLKQKQYSGIETYCGWLKLAGKQFAEYVHNSTVTASNAKDLGVACSNYVVVKYTRMPGALIEIGYMSNDKERKKMTSQAYQQTLAQGIADGVINYAKDNLGYTQP